MKKFSKLIEARGDTAIFCIGRFNPPTTGHLKMIEAAARIQKQNPGAPFYVFPTHSQDPKKNPLPHALKVAYMKKMFKKYAKNIQVSKARNVFEMSTMLYDKGHRAIVLVAGSDRVTEFDKLLNQYNGVEGRHGYYGFDNIEVVSAGERDPDAEGVEGMSASKMREAASKDDYDSFKQGLPAGFKEGEKLYKDVRKNMGIREERDMGDMTDYEQLRDAYLTGKIWNIDDFVEANGVEGRVVNKGTNYLAFCDGSGKVHKAWLYDIALNERNYRKEYDNYHSRPEQIEKRSSRNKARRVMGHKVVKGMDVGHSDNNPLNNDPKNLRNEDPSKNRREPRLREASAPDVKKGDVIILSKSKRPYKMGGMVDPKTTLPAESDKMVVKRITKSKDGRKAHLTYHDPKKRGGFAIYLDKMPDFMSVKIAEELDEDSYLDWLNKLLNKIDQTTHPKKMDTMIKDYIEGMRSKEHRKHPSAWAHTVSREYNVNARTFIQYINKLVKIGKLPKELEAAKKLTKSGQFTDPMKWGQYVEEVEFDDLNWIKTGGMVGKKRRFPTFVIKKEGNKYKAYDEQNKMNFKAGANSLNSLAKMLKPYIEKRTGSWVFEEKYISFKELVDRIQQIDEDFPVQVTVKDKKGKTHTISTRDLRGATHALLIHYKELPPVKGGLPGRKEIKSPKTEIFLGTEKKLAKTAKRMLKQHPAAKYATGAEVVKLDQKMVKGATLEVLSKGADMGDYIDDFAKSDAPHFKGKSKEKRKDMAIAAYMSRNS